MPVFPASWKLRFKADRELEAMKLGRESRTASRQMGRQVIRLAANQQARHPLIEDYLAAVEAEQTPGHLAVSLGLTLAAAGWSKEDTIAAFLYQTATGFVAAAMKLMPIGQREGQRLLESWIEVIERVSHKAAHQPVLQSWSPIQDIYAMRHSRLESRLFRSSLRKVCSYHRLDSCIERMNIFVATGVSRRRGRVIFL